ncbi:MAG: glycoside hydrolase family 9 protein [Uliginosibacterium sp.]|nr:glycoside hydrolase family 9 protein [Uliginosibacterium sp.]
MVSPFVDPGKESSGIRVRDSVGHGGSACYQDHIDLYMTNEVAVNWNAALFFLAAYLN